MSLSGPIHFERESQLSTLGLCANIRKKLLSIPVHSFDTTGDGTYLTHFLVSIEEVLDLTSALMIALRVLFPNRRMSSNSPSVTAGVCNNGKSDDRAARAPPANLTRATSQNPDCNCAVFPRAIFYVEDRKHFLNSKPSCGLNNWPITSGPLSGQAEQRGRSQTKPALPKGSRTPRRNVCEPPSRDMHGES